MGVVAAARRCGMDAAWGASIEAANGARWTALGTLLEDVAGAVAATLAEGALPVVLGGDHAMAAGTWRGVGRALGAAPGLLWIDAHLDAHTPESSPSGNPHGMPLAALLGLGAAEMAGLAGPTLDPRRVVVLGARSCEAAEVELVAAHGVTVLSMADIRQRGLSAVFADALAIVAAGGQPYGISVDLDAIDPLFAPGVATPVPGGIRGDALCQALAGALRARQCVTLEIAEYCPPRDLQERTARLAIALVEAACLRNADALR